MARALKRLIDVVAAAAGLILLSPVMGVVALAVWLSMGRPVLFRQIRPGYREQPITIVKFRTMNDLVGPDGQPLPDGERLTPLGRFLRRTSLDELPQLWNVLKGDLSLVGPRPLLMKYLPYYSLRERLRFTVRPGLTGWAQIQGRNNLSWAQRLEYDAWYVENWSLWLDLKILIQTVVYVLRRRDVAVDARSLMLDLDQERQQGSIRVGR